jgi:4-amino-4-deoxy-L-arabinose transferase-like glycosyltransferase
MRVPSRLTSIKSAFLADKKWSYSLTALSLGAGLLTLWQLQSVARSEYYAAIARSMSINFGNFFFGAIDPAGTVTLDKIPGSYWLPAIFARIFGFSTWSITAPNALATIALVIVALQGFWPEQ